TQPAGDRLIRQLRACEAAALAFCRLLERWSKGEPEPSTAGGRDAAPGGGGRAARRRPADRAETALAGLEQPLKRYLVELQPDRTEGRSWYGGPGARGLVSWEKVFARA